VANSVSVADDARETLGRLATVTPLWNAVDLRRFTPDGPRLDLDALAGMPAQAAPVRVGLLATFGRWKGHTTFIDALAQLPRDLPIVGYIIGGPVYRTDGSQYSLEELRTYARRAGVADRVGFTGFLREADAALRALDIVVHASTEPEPFGLAIAEAMACRRAVIVADAGGARELVTPGVDALAHEPGNARSLAERILALTVGDRLRRRVAAAARDTAVRRFDRTRLASELVPVYERALHRRACA
jgi:glycosyltransferase involved in cell wall biosynthesis